MLTINAYDMHFLPPNILLFNGIKGKNYDSIEIGSIFQNVKNKRYNIIEVKGMKKSDKDDLLWNMLKLWISIPRSIRIAFLWAFILGISYLGWVKLIHRFI